MTNTNHDYPDALRDIVGALINHDRRAADAHIAAIAHQQRPLAPRRTPSVRDLAAIYERDRYQCCYCGAKTVLTPVMRLVSTAYPGQFPYDQNWKAGAVHPAIENVSATHDHVDPVTRGGAPLDPTNIVTACWVCNSAKGNLSLDALGWTLRNPADDSWHGLADVYPQLWESLDCPPLGSNERAWLGVVRNLYGRQL